MSFFRHIVGCVFYMNKNQRKSLEFDVKAKNSDILFRMLNKSSHLNRSQLCNSWKIEVRGQKYPLNCNMGGKNIYKCELCLRGNFGFKNKQAHCSDCCQHGSSFTS